MTSRIVSEDIGGTLDDGAVALDDGAVALDDGHDRDIHVGDERDERDIHGRALKVTTELLNLKQKISTDLGKIKDLDSRQLSLEETRKVLEKIDLINRFKKYHALIINVKNTISDLQLSDKMDVKESLLVLKNIKESELDLSEFSIEIREFVENKSTSIRNRGKILLLEHVKKVGWYKGDLSKFTNLQDILPLMIQVNGIVLQVLMEGPMEEFKWNFSGKRSTNRRDKPEWIFKFVLQVLEKVEKWVKDTFPLEIWSEFLLKWQEEVLKKLNKELKKMDIKQVLHLVKEIKDFDMKLYQRFQVKDSLMGMVLEEEESRELIMGIILKESLEKLKDWLQEDQAFSQDLESEVKCCTNLIGLISVLEEDYFELLKEEQKTYFTREIFIVLLETYHNTLQDKCLQNDLEKDFEKRLRKLGGYHMGCVQINQWLDVYISSFSDLEHDLFEKLEQQFRDLQLEIEYSLAKEFETLMKTDLYEYKYEKDGYKGLEQLTPAFTRLSLGLDSVFEILEKYWSSLSFKRIGSKIIDKVEVEFSRRSIRKYDLETGILPIIAKRGFSLHQDKIKKIIH